MIKRKQHLIIALILLLTSCQNNTSTTDKNIEKTIDKAKRDYLVSKYDLLNFPDFKEPVFLTVDEFFDGNNDVASIAPNLDTKLPVKEYYQILKALSKSPKNMDVFVELKDVMINENGQLNENEWFYTDIVYFVGDFSKEEIKEITKSLQPDEVEYDNEKVIKGLGERYKNKKVVYVWWD